MKPLTRLLFTLVFYPLALLLAHAEDISPLQNMIDNTEEGGTLLIPAGVYKGSVSIEKPITLDGQNMVTIDAGGKGSVIYLDADSSVIKNLRLINSGSSHNDLDSGIQVRGNFNVIRDNAIEDCLFGIDLQLSENNIVKRNSISSKDAEMGLRGDAIRLWYSFKNKITDNTIKNARDMVVWYSRDNQIKNNVTRGGRYGLHFMYSQYNEVTGNEFYNNSVGIFLMYSDGVKIRDNLISHATGASGIGIGFKETSDVEITNNKVLFSSAALSIDVSPYQPDTVNIFRNNLIAYNGIGVRFLSDWHSNHFVSNYFKSNITPVVVAGGQSAKRNNWSGNFWDDYEGFDLDKNGVGDTPFRLYAYADRIWMDVQGAQFFKGSAMLELLDFLERLAPFSDPQLLLEDSSPLVNADWEMPNVSAQKPVNKYFQ